MMKAPDARYYPAFLNSLRGLIDDAEIGGHDPEGLAALNQALAIFEHECGMWMASQAEKPE